MSSRVVVPSILALAAFGILIALGVWQWERRTWKNDLIARFESALSHPAADYVPPANGDETGREFMRVRIRGTLENADTVKLFTPTPEALRTKTQDGFGYLLFTPLKFGGDIVLVNRGFVPDSLAGKQSHLSGGQREITGIVRLSEQPSWFTPPPEPAKRLFFAADVPAMAAAAHVSGGHVIESEYIQAEPTGKDQLWPSPRDPHELLASIPNRHLEYTLTWFGLAATLAGVCGTYLFRG